MDKAIEVIVNVLVALTTVAIVAVLVSNRSNTAQVLQSGLQGYAGALTAAQQG